MSSNRIPDSELSEVASAARHAREVAVIRTYLAMDRPEQLRPGAPPSSRASLVDIDPCSVDTWRDLYARVGGPWHWHDRDAWSDDRLDAHLEDRNVRFLRARIDMPEGPVDPPTYPDGAPPMEPPPMDYPPMLEGPGMMPSVSCMAMM